MVWVGEEVVAGRIEFGGGALGCGICVVEAFLGAKEELVEDEADLEDVGGGAFDGAGAGKVAAVERMIWVAESFFLGKC